MNRIRMPLQLMFGLIFSVFFSSLLLAQTQGTVPTSASSPASDLIVEYPASFFARYKPNTALDMINQTPGFQLSDGDASRGLGAAAGNVLINDRRPSAKQDLPSLILTRIPASLVERIEIIHGQVRDIDLQGQGIVANIVLRVDSPAAIRWEAVWRYNVDYFSTFEGGISISDRWRETDYNAGLNFRRFTRGDLTFQDTTNGQGTLIERKLDDADLAGLRGGGNLTTSTRFGLTLVQFNANFNGEERDGMRIAKRTPVATGGIKRDEYIGEDFNTGKIEIGVDAERELTDDLTGKAIVVLTHGGENTISTLDRYNAIGVKSLARIADTQTDSTEAISRAEFDWEVIANHNIQANVEGAFNSLDGTLEQTEDTGKGPINVSVPGGNSRVEEVRWDFLLKDTWALGQFKLDYGVGAETSTISQSGDATQERSFFFVKPQTVLTYSANKSSQSRVRLAREVAQLDFADFVSATVFEDDDLALGNPDIRPDSTWIAEFSQEQRFGSESVVKLTVFHHWIKDVLDLLPLSPTFEAPGNIGDGTRWGFNIENTLPLDWLGLRDAKLDINARWQKSSVTDPVTGKKRIFSHRTPPSAIFPLKFNDDTRFAVTVDFRQDFQAARVAWGWDVRTRAERPLFKVNELDVADDDYEFNVFVETTRYFGMKSKIVAENILDMVESRDRLIYTGERELSPLALHETRERTRGFRVSFELSGSF